MASYNFFDPLFTDGTSFDPTVDTINFGGTPASGISVSNIGPYVILINAGGTSKSINLAAYPTGVDSANPVLSLRDGAFICGGGTIFRVGDGLASSAGDNSGTFTVNGTAGNDHIEMFGSSDTINAGGGNDVVILSVNSATGQPSNDFVDGGGGTGDSLFVNVAPGGFIDLNLGMGFGNWFSNGASNSLTVQNVETISGTGGNDSMMGGISPMIGYTWTDYDWSGPGVRTSDFQTFKASAGYDALGGNGLADGLRQVVDYSSLPGMQGINMWMGGGGDENPWRFVYKATGPLDPFGNPGFETDNLYSVTRVIGTNFADYLVGGSNVRNQWGGLQEEFVGNGGNDTIDGGYGNDIVIYGSAMNGVNVDLGAGTATDATGASIGTDTLIQVEGIVGTNYADSLVGSAANNFLQPTSGNDVVDGKGGFDTLVYAGSAQGVNVSLAVTTAQTTGKMYQNPAGGFFFGTDTISHIESLRGTDFNDTLTGGGVQIAGTDPDAYRLFTGSRNEFFEGRAGNDIIDGGNDHDANLGIYGDESYGFDFAIYQRAPDAVAINLSMTTTDGSGTYVLADDGYGTQDKLYNINALGGTRFDDVLVGDAGKNAFRGEDGNDIIDGGDGEDSVSYTSSLEGVHVDLDAGFAYDGMGYWVNGINHAGMTMGFWHEGGMDLLSNIEFAVGSDFDDNFFGDGGANKFWGGAGYDFFDSRDLGADSLWGGQDDDTYFVKLGDVVTEYAGEGYDSVVSFGNFTIAAGNEIEELAVRGGNATTLVGRVGKGNELNNRVAGDKFNDTLYGLGGNDSLSGGAGNDIMDGGTGNDGVSYRTASAGVIVTLNSALQQNTVSAGLDTLKNFENLEGSAFADNLEGRDVGTAAVTANNMMAGLGGNDTMAGLGGNDTMDGGNGNDIMDGGSGNDMLLGGNGNDVIIGGLGLDSMTGGLGADAFKFVTMSDGTTGEAISDFTVGQDKIQVVEGNFTGQLVGQPIVFVSRSSNNAPIGTDAQFVFNQSSGLLKFDPDGTTTATSYTIATLTGVNNLTAADIQVVAA